MFSHKLILKNESEMSNTRSELKLKLKQIILSLIELDDIYDFLWALDNKNLDKFYQNEFYKNNQPLFIKIAGLQMHLVAYAKDEAIDVLALFAEILFLENKVVAMADNDDSKLKLVYQEKQGNQEKLQDLKELLSQREKANKEKQKNKLPPNPIIDIKKIRQEFSDVEERKSSPGLRRAQKAISLLLFPLLYTLKKMFTALKNIAANYKTSRSVFRLFAILTGSIGGGIGGAVAGTLIFPGVGTIIGAVLGAVFGGMAGTLIAKQLSRGISYLFNRHHVHPTNPEKYTVNNSAVVKLKENSPDQSNVNSLTQVYSALFQLRQQKKKLGLSLPFVPNREKSQLNDAIQTVRTTGRILEEVGATLNITDGEINPPTDKAVANAIKVQAENQWAAASNRR